MSQGVRIRRSDLVARARGFMHVSAKLSFVSAD